METFKEGDRVKIESRYEKYAEHFPWRLDGWVKHWLPIGGGEYALTFETWWNSVITVTTIDWEISPG